VLCFSKPTVLDGSDFEWHEEKGNEQFEFKISTVTKRGTRQSSLEHFTRCLEHLEDTDEDEKRTYL